MAMNCFSSLSGADVATTARFSVDKKKAMVSISTAVLPAVLRMPMYSHISAHRAPNAVRIAPKCSVPTESQS